MSESETKIPVETVQEDEEKLKYLEFVQGAAIYVIVCFSTLYEYAKENSGPLKPGVQTVEGTVGTVVGPVYEKFHDVPLELLKFVDRKMDELLNELDRHVPSVMKHAPCQLLSAAENAPQMARELASEIQRNGVIDAASNIAKTVYLKYEPTAKDLYITYEPLAEQYAVSAWSSLNRLPLFPQVAHIMVPTAAYWAERYNQAVGWAADRGYTASYYLPMVPIDRIAKVFESQGYGQRVLINGDTAAPTQ